MGSFFNIFLVLLGVVDIVIEIIETVWLIAQNDYNYLGFCLYNVVAMLRGLSVIAGFVTICNASGGFSERTKYLLELYTNICMEIVLIPVGIVTLGLCYFLWNKSESDDIVKILAVYMLVYCLIKTLIFVGFCECFKKIIKDVTEVYYYRPVLPFGQTGMMMIPQTSPYFGRYIPSL